MISAKIKGTDPNKDLAVIAVKLSDIPDETMESIKIATVGDSSTLKVGEQYKNEIVDAMIKKFGYKNIMEVPKLDKVVINMGVGEAKENAKVLDSAVKDLETIAGQKVVLTRAKNSVANFKIRQRSRKPRFVKQ